MLRLPDFSLLLVMVCFWLVYFLVQHYLLKPVVGVLDQREQHVQRGREQLAAAQAELEAALRQVEQELARAAAEAQALREQWRAEGERLRQGRLAAAREQGEKQLESFSRQLEQLTQQARGELRREAQELARRLAEKLLGRALAS